MTRFRLRGRLVAGDILTDKGCRARRDLSVGFSGGAAGGWWPLLTPAREGRDVGRPRILLVREHPDSAAPALAQPLGFGLLWRDRCDADFYRAGAPAGFVALGDLFSVHPEPPVRCVAADCLREVRLGGCIWDDRGSGNRNSISLWAIEGSGKGGWQGFRASSSPGRPPDGPTWWLDTSLVEMVGDG